MLQKAGQQFSCSTDGLLRLTQYRGVLGNGRTIDTYAVWSSEGDISITIPCWTSDDVIILTLTPALTLFPTPTYSKVMHQQPPPASFVILRRYGRAAIVVLAIFSVIIPPPCHPLPPAPRHARLVSLRDGIESALRSKPASRTGVGKRRWTSCKRCRRKASGLTSSPTQEVRML